MRYIEFTQRQDLETLYITRPPSTLKVRLPAEGQKEGRGDRQNRDRRRDVDVDPVHDRRSWTISARNLSRKSEGKTENAPFRQDRCG